MNVMCRMSRRDPLILMEDSVHAVQESAGAGVSAGAGADCQLATRPVMVRRHACRDAAPESNVLRQKGLLSLCPDMLACDL
jgi:hypothetical protein